MIFRDSRETLNSNFSEQSSSKYLSWPILKFKLNDSYSMIGYHLPISIFQQLAVIELFNDPVLFPPTN